MAKNLTYYALIVILVLSFSRCSLEKAQSINYLDSSAQPAPVFPSLNSQIHVIEYQNQTIQTVPDKNSHHYNWNDTIQLMISKMLQEQNIPISSVLLIDSLNNQTNGSLNSWEATEILRKVIMNSRKFMLVPLQQLFLVKQQLGLSPQDSLSSRSKAIGIARSVGAQYVLYSNATGNINAPSLQIQLILVSTGEIIWSWENTVTQF